MRASVHEWLRWSLLGKGHRVLNDYSTYSSTLQEYTCHVSQCTWSKCYMQMGLHATTWYVDSFLKHRKIAILTTMKISCEAGKHTHTFTYCTTTYAHNTYNMHNKCKCSRMMYCDSLPMCSDFFSKTIWLAWTEPGFNTPCVSTNFAQPSNISSQGSNYNTLIMYVVVL